MKAIDWIDRVRAAHGMPSDYAAAKALGVSRQAISEYRTRIPTMDEDMSMKVAHLLSVDPAIVLADQAMERAKNAEARSAWATVLQRLGGVAAGFLVVVGVNPALLNDVAALCALCKPEDAPAAAPARRRPAARGAIGHMARTLSHTPARA